MTSNQKEMLKAFANGLDVNDAREIAEIAGNSQLTRFRKTCLSLFRKGYLRTREGGGLELSPRGHQAAAAIAADGDR